jgi:hypothetical protein
MKACVVVMAVGAFVLVPARAAEVFHAGNFYTPLDNGWVVERNGSLDEVRRFRVPGMYSATGCTFNDRNELVMIAQLAGTVRLLAVNADGAIVRSYDTHEGSLFRGSYVDYDANRGIYAFADQSRITFLDRNFSLLGSTQNIFGRATGVTFAADGSLFAADSVNYRIRVINSTTFAETRSFQYFSDVLTGMDMGADGFLRVSQFGAGRIDRVNPANGNRALLIDNLGFGGVSSVTELPGGRLLTVNGLAALRLYTANGTLLDSDAGPGEFGDGVAYFVPAPGGLVLGAVAMTALARRRRR